VGNGSGTSRVNIGGSGNLTAGAGTIVTSGGQLSGGVTQATNGLQSGANAGKITLLSGGILAPGNLNSAASTLFQVTGKGLGSSYNGNQNGATNNVLNATNLTWYAGGTLSFYLDSTAQNGNALNPSASTLLNLGTGALAKGGGTGAYILNFNNTGAWNTTGVESNSQGGTDYSNTYDLINFGVTNNYGVINPITTFNINDFTIENLNGVGTLSFYYNPNGDNGVGQEELLLTVVPEPSTWAMLLGGLATLLFWTRRRNSRRTALNKTK